MKKRDVKSYSKLLALLLATASVGSTITGCGQGENTEEVMSEVIPVQVQNPEEGKLTLKKSLLPQNRNDKNENYKYNNKNT